MEIETPLPPSPENEAPVVPTIISKKTRFLFSYVAYGVAALTLTALCAGGVLLYTAKDSLPGEPLYIVKTEGTEQIQLFLKRSTESRAKYNNSLLEARLRELQTLSTDTQVTTPEVLTQIALRATSHISDTTAVLEKSDLSFEDKINLLAPLSDVTRAMEVLVDSTDEFSSIKTAIGDNDGAANEALENALTAFAEAGPIERVFALIQSETKILAEESTKVAYGSTAQKAVARRAEDTADALTENNFKDALGYILKAQQAIMVDTYLFDAERGPLDGIPIEPGTMPEGS